MSRNIPLLCGAIGSFFIAALHVAILIAGPVWFRYFGAPDLAIQIERGSTLAPTLLTLAVALVFAIWGAYALAGLGAIGRLPAVRPVLFAIGAVYALRGLLLVPALVYLLRGGALHAPRYLVFSAFSLALGICHLLGAWRAGGRANNRILS